MHRDRVDHPLTLIMSTIVYKTEVEAGRPPSIASLEKKNEADVAVVVQHVGPVPVELERNFSFWACLGLAFALLNSWTAM